MRRIAEFKKENVKLLNNLMPNDEKVAFAEHDVVNVLTNRDQDGRRVLVVNCGGKFLKTIKWNIIIWFLFIGSWNTKEVTSDQLFRLFYLIHLVAVLEPSSQICGVVVIMDFSGLSLKQVAALSPAFSKRLLTFIQEAMPLRLKEVHMIKQPFIFNMVWNLFKPFIREKLKGRVSLVYNKKMNMWESFISHL